MAFEDNIAEKNIELNCDIDDVYISSSPSLLEIVWNNLLSNAVKFCSNDGTISISLKKTDTGCSVSVSDTGEGFSEEVGKRLFEKFYQGDSSRSQLGNGLGLALVKRVIDLLGGTIEVESTLGVGSTFTVHIKDLK